MSNNNDYELGHEYDGIKENDYPMPGWWTWGFIITIIFAFIYYIHYEVSGNGLTLKQELEVSMKQLNELQAKSENQSPVLTEEELDNKIKDPQLINAGMAIFQSKCAICHGDKLEGKIGPNLVDKTWIHGSKATEIITVIRKGVLDKGMPPWEGVLKPNEVLQVLAFVKSKQE